jgi:hypothetical protein
MPALPLDAGGIGAVCRQSLLRRCLIYSVVNIPVCPLPQLQCSSRHVADMPENPTCRVSCRHPWRHVLHHVADMSNDMLPTCRLRHCMSVLWGSGRHADIRHLPTKVFVVVVVIFIVIVVGSDPGGCMIEGIEPIPSMAFMSLDDQSDTIRWCL